jgi:hypothetical protein
MSKLVNPEVEFDNFMSAVGLTALPKDEMQYQEMRKTFFAGMMCMFGKLAFELPEMTDEEEASQELQDIFTALKATHSPV